MGFREYRGSEQRPRAFVSSPDHTPDDPDTFAIHLEPMPDGWIRVVVRGELAIPSAAELERAVEHELLERRHVLLDLSRIDFIDSTGLRAMTTVVRAAKAYGLQLRLSSELPPHARRLMEIVGLLPFVPIESDDPETIGLGSRWDEDA
jgi:anti-sigma B factor antagonist